jgi:hypothetical protein
MTNLSASDLTKLTVLIDGQPRGRLATIVKTVERLTKTLAEALADPNAAAKMNRPGFTGGQNSWRIARYGTDTEEDREAVFP